MPGEVLDEGIEVGLGEAVEEEVGGDEIGGGVRGVGQGVLMVGGQEWGVVAALAEELEHGGAGVYGVDLNVWVDVEEGLGEAAVSVA